MANLETLELTIKANAESASGGLNKLISSLSLLSKEVGKNVGGLKLLNNELSKIKNLRNIKMPNLSDATGANKTVSASQKQAEAIEEWKKNRKPLTISHFRDNDRTEEEQRKLFPQWFNDYDSPEWKAKIEANQALIEKNRETEKTFSEPIGSTDKVSKSMESVAKSADIPTTKIDALKMKLDSLDDAMDKAASKGDTLTLANKRLAQISTAEKLAKETDAMQNQTKEASSLGKALEAAKGKMQGVGKALGRIGRIASTMLIRTALRSMMKAFSEAWSSAYEFSKSMGGDFAQSVDKVRGLISGTAINIVKTFAPAIQALLPVLSAVASAVQYLCNAIQSLLSLLGMSSGLWGASTDSIQKYSKAAGGGSKANKEMLASFDELNVISQESGGGGGGAGGSAMTGFSDVISSEFDAITSLLVGEGLVALGLILACTGHIPIGVGLIAIGVAGIVKTIVSDWGSLSTKVQGQLATIMSIVGVSTLALGAILAFSGANIPLGIGLMVLGAANLAAVAYVNWGGKLPQEVQTTITKITTIVGAALLALGAILAFSGVKIGLGIGLMAAGALSLGTAVMLNWSTMDKNMQSVVSKITAIVSGALLVIGSILAFTGVRIGLGVALIAAGAVGLVATIGLNWNNLSDSVKSTVTTITAIVSGALLAVGAVIAFTGVGIALGIALMAAGAVGLATVVGLNWNSIEMSLKNPVNRITALVSGALLAVGALLTFTGVGIPLGLAMMAAGGIGLVAAINPDWGGIINNVVTCFGTVRDLLVAGWTEVKKTVESVLETILQITGAKHVVEIVQTVSTVSTPGTKENYAAKVVSAVAKQSNNLLAQVGAKILDVFSSQTSGSSGGHGYAEGGFPKQGSLFIANEAGAELIGDINGKTSVANQGQIIEGISSGVERANAEQNALLREQNNLLRGILEKETSVRIGASASLGRTVKRSLDMYGMVGG